MEILKLYKRGKLIILFFVVTIIVVFAVIFSFGRKNEFPEVQRLSKGNFSDIDDFENFFLEVANKKGAVYAFNLLAVAPLPSSTDVHALGHVIGNILYKERGLEGIKDCTNDFRNACSHSIVIETFLNRGPDSIVDIAESCRNTRGGPEAYAICLHGLGHGIMAYNNYRIIPALSFCNRVENAGYDNVEIQECVGGIIMESIIGAHDPLAWEEQKESYFRKDDPLYPCNQYFVPEKGRRGCFFHLTPHLWDAAGVDTGDPKQEDFERAFGFCERLTGNLAEYAIDCYEGFGKEFVGFVQAGDIRKIPDMSNKQLETIGSWCLLAHNPAGREVCIKQALGSLFWGAETRSDTLLRFCEALDSPDYKTICYEHLDVILEETKTND